MKDYFLGLILFAFFGSIVLSIAPRGLSRTYLRFLCGLCSIGCIIFPLVTLLSDGGSEGEYIESLFETELQDANKSVEIYNSYIDDVALTNAEKSLKEKIIAETKSKEADFDVDIILAENGGEIYIKVARVCFYHSGYDIDPRKVEKICFSELGCECEFLYK